MNVLKTLRLAGVVAMMGAAALTSASAQEPAHLKMGSFNVGGSWYIYATAIAKIATPALPKGSVIEILPYQGGVGNPILVNRGKADLALSFSALSNWAYKGKVTYKEPNTNIRGLVGGLNTPHRLAIISRTSLGIHSLQDIKDKKLAVNLITVQRGGAGEALAEMALESYGMDYDTIKSFGGTVTHVDLPVALQRLRDGQADILIHNVGYRQPDVMELALGGGLTFLPLGEKQMQEISEKYGLEPGLAIKKDEFQGVTEDVASVGYPTGIIVNKDMPDDVAYAITKAICEHPEELASAHASLKAFQPEKAFMPGKNGAIPLHPGAMRYYKERGWM